MDQLCWKNSFMGGFRFCICIKGLPPYIAKRMGFAIWLYGQKNSSKLLFYMPLNPSVVASSSANQPIAMENQHAMELLL